MVDMMGHSEAGLGTLAGRLKAARALAGISGRELGRLAGVSETYPSMIESGLRPNVEGHIVDRFAVVLGVSCDWLLGGRGEMPSEGEMQAAVARARAQAATGATGTDG